MLPLSPSIQMWQNLSNCLQFGENRSDFYSFTRPDKQNMQPNTLNVLLRITFVHTYDQSDVVQYIMHCARMRYASAFYPLWVCDITGNGNYVTYSYEISNMNIYM